MSKNFYGYIRVSSLDQNDIRQRIELNRYGIVEKNIYADKQSGKDFNRPQYQKLRKKLRKGDVLIVKSLDRLGRNYEEIQEEWRYITKKIKADIVILDMPILDTRTNKDLIGTLISDIVLQLLSYVAQAERENIKQRQAEGIAAAKAQGKHLGRPLGPYPDGFDEVFKLYTAKQIGKNDSAERLGITPDSFRWYVIRKKRDLEKKLNKTDL